MEPIKNEIRFEGCGEILRDVRQKSRKTLRELAELVGCSHSKLTKIENDALAVSLTMIEKIASELRIRPEDIILRCFERRFPKLLETKGGSLIAQFLSSAQG